ncbi:hypothetical protein [Paenibacillus lemnae]|uniref:Uncharacterized protein n=1 Tax=Paenibacillus lemnae TaxID=1330551 RepID=A0A848MDB2_PAELE|nr:hypothetical protein [Paenibacillus lemnae]NMO98181.1 hypothetical protein [Paenibacillus lemnae]
MMPLIFKKFTFWFVLFSLFICLMNLSGQDDKNILVFLTNPINLYLEGWLTRMNTNPDTTDIFKPIVYLLHLLFWAILGIAIDSLIKIVEKFKMKEN